MRGAGGTEGGTGRFLMGLVMLVGGGYLLLVSIRVHSHFGFGSALFNMGSVGVTTGMVLIPFVLGVGALFYSGRNPVGWVLAGGALVAMVFGVLSNVQLHLREMSVFSLLTILVLFVGGIGLVLSSLRDRSERPAED